LSLNQTTTFMKFNCKEIEIENEEFGYTLTLSEHKTDHKIDMNKSPEELMNSTQKYILLQRTYPEDDLDNDYYYFEPSDSDKACELKDFVINLFRARFELILNGDFYEIQLNANDQKFEQLKLALQTITNGTGTLIIHAKTD
jgi:hypothetical protein